jgi:anhydro-N-acetylmuramic acid kinase
MLVIGLISGTSIDAIDAALVEIRRQDALLRVRLRAFAMLPFADELQERVRALLPPATGSTAEVCEVNVLLGEAFARAALTLADQANTPISAVDLIASHGQTVYHQVASGATRSTLQLGAAAVLAERTDCTVVSDFRPRDMAAGGEGAPLVPFLDQLLFRDPQRYRAIQNIGGIGNVTYLPPDGPALAFDTGPGNVLIDEAVRVLTDGGATFDRDGRMASAGAIDQALLSEWLTHPFFAQIPPKSTGRELFGPAEAQRYIAQASERGLLPSDIVATLTALTAQSIAQTYRQFLGRVDEVLVGGGGARNPALLTQLQAALPDVMVMPIDAFGLDGDAKEALAFALIGYATLLGWPGNVPSATGANQPVTLGSITPGANYRALLREALQAPAEPPSNLRIRLDQDHLRSASS